MKRGPEPTETASGTGTGKAPAPSAAPVTAAHAALLRQGLQRRHARALEQLAGRAATVRPFIAARGAVL